MIDFQLIVGIITLCSMLPEDLETQTAECTREHYVVVEPPWTYCVTVGKTISARESSITVFVWDKRRGLCEWEERRE